MNADIETTVTLAAFESCLGQRFRVAVDGAALEVTLVEAKSAGEGIRDGGAFTLMFVGPTDRLLDQGVFELSRDDLEIAVFLVPIGPFGDGYGYEAVFA